MFGSKSAPPGEGGTPLPSTPNPACRIYVVAGQPSSGKTSLANWLAKLIWRKRQIKSVVCSTDVFRTSEERRAGNWFPAYLRIHQHAITALQRGEWIIYDACNLTPPGRWSRPAAIRIECNQLIAEVNLIVMQRSWADCRRAERTREDRGGSDHRRAVLNMLRRMESQGMLNPAWWTQVFKEPWDHIFKAYWDEGNPTKPYIFEKVR